MRILVFVALFTVGLDAWAADSLKGFENLSAFSNPSTARTGLLEITCADKNEKFQKWVINLAENGATKQMGIRSLEVIKHDGNLIHEFKAVEPANVMIDMDFQKVSDQTFRVKAFANQTFGNGILSVGINTQEVTNEATKTTVEGNSNVTEFEVGAETFLLKHILSDEKNPAMNLISVTPKNSCKFKIKLDK